MNNITQVLLYGATFFLALFAVTATALAQVDGLKRKLVRTLLCNDCLMSGFWGLTIMVGIGFWMLFSDTAFNLLVLAIFYDLLLVYVLYISIVLFKREILRVFFGIHAEH